MNTFNEAPASVSYSLVSPMGYPLTFTVRDAKEEDLLAKMSQLEVEFSSQGFTAATKGSQMKFPTKEKEYVEGEKCPKCGAGVVLGTTKDGKAFKKCEKAKWDFNAKKNVGCSYFEFTDKSSNSGGELATPAQEALIKAKLPFMWEEGLTKAEASEIIGKNLTK